MKRTIWKGHALAGSLLLLGAPRVHGIGEGSVGSGAPWSDDAQVEQDLVLSRAVVELFQRSELAKQIALRGGTALSKLFIQPACRYSAS
jgi:hypothetical protein